MDVEQSSGASMEEVPSSSSSSSSSSSQAQEEAKEGQQARRRTAEAILVDLVGAHQCADDPTDSIPSSADEDVPSTATCEEGRSPYKTRRFRVRFSCIPLCSSMN